jgi:thymidylate synthase ThyX
MKVHSGKQCEVSVLEHSLNAYSGKELITYQLKYPRYCHAEFLTHRVFSRNSSSTRAIPTKKMIDAVKENPAFFTYIGKNMPGMQAQEEVKDVIKVNFYKEWIELANICAEYAERWSSQYNIHKQTVGRCLEPFSYITVVVTATEWDNWFELRNHKDAQPEIQDLALTMLEALSDSSPIIRRWHLPYISEEERNTESLPNLLAMSAARCARVSYLTHDKQSPSLQQDLELYSKLIGSKPLHASPLEHQAFANISSFNNFLARNFGNDWIQHRAILEWKGSIFELQNTLNDRFLK